MTNKIKNIIIEDERELSDGEIQYNNLDDRLQSSIDLINYLIRENLASRLLKEEYFGYGTKGTGTSITNRIGIKPEYLINIENLKNIIINNTDLNYDIHISFFVVKDNATAIYNSGWITNTKNINVLNYPTAKYMSIYVRNKNNENIAPSEIENLVNSIQIYFISNISDENVNIDKLLNIIENDNIVKKLDKTVKGYLNGGVIKVNSISGMIDINKIYVNTTDGNWYYYNGSSWAVGGTYQATEDSKNIDKLNSMISLIEPINLFDKSKCVVGKFARGEVGQEYTEATNSQFAYYIIDFPKGSTFTCSGSSFNCYLLDENNIIRVIRGRASSEIAPFTVTNDIVSYNITKMIVNFKISIYPIDSYMIVNGNTLPATYSEFFEPYVRLNYEQYYAMLSDLDDYVKKTEVPGFGKEYYVGSNKDFTSFIACLEALQGDSSEKTVYIDAGEYDIFDEIGGSEFALSIPSGTDWRDVSVIVPPNTKIIGLGKVIFRFEPTAQEIGSVASTLLSPLNVSGTCHIENLDIIADNCRYCIHDETSGDIQYTGAKKTYKNVHCIKKSTGNLGYQQAYASGFDDKMIFEFDNCIFESNKLPFSVHNRDTQSAINSSKIFANNCAFICGDSDTKSLRLGNVSWRTEEIPVVLNNCYLNKEVYIYPETAYGKQNYNLTMLGCSNVTIDIVLKDGDTNTFVPKVLSI